MSTYTPYTPKNRDRCKLVYVGKLNKKIKKPPENFRRLRTLHNCSEVNYAIGGSTEQNVKAV